MLRASSRFATSSHRQEQRPRRKRRVLEPNLSILVGVFTIYPNIFRECRQENIFCFLLTGIMQDILSMERKKTRVVQRLFVCVEVYRYRRYTLCQSTIPDRDYFTTSSCPGGRAPKTIRPKITRGGGGGLFQTIPGFGREFFYNIPYRGSNRIIPSPMALLYPSWKPLSAWGKLLYVIQ